MGCNNIRLCQLFCVRLYLHCLFTNCVIFCFANLVTRIPTFTNCVISTLLNCLTQLLTFLLRITKLWELEFGYLVTWLLFIVHFIVHFCPISSHPPPPPLSLMLLKVSLASLTGITTVLDLSLD